ncbi:lipoyl(octanoyl) transferase LipB [bacterium]|nr:lipoyl(octanoyl) transferase LipB [bacterium]
MGNAAHELSVEWRGRERYADTWAHQLDLHGLRRAGEIGDTLVLVEHEPVITLGRSGDIGNLTVNREALSSAGLDFHRVERGGDITYHGPGQLVGYPIISLRERGLSVRELMRGLEETLIRTVAQYGIEAERVPGMSGVWRGKMKLAAIGVAVRGGVSYHGFALNVSTDLSHFDYIVPCGIEDLSVTSMAQILSQRVEMDMVQYSLTYQFGKAMGFRMVESERALLG